MTSPAGSSCTAANGRSKAACWSGATARIGARTPQRAVPGCAPKNNMAAPAGEWNHVRIVTHGRRIEIWWNGEKTIDYETDRLTQGYLGLQNHDSKSTVKFRNIRITEQ